MPGICRVRFRCRCRVGVRLRVRCRVSLRVRVRVRVTVKVRVRVRVSLLTDWEVNLFPFEIPLVYPCSLT